jgi:alpha-amylase/alpha-mannosidase (GH57 family)
MHQPPGNLEYLLEHHEWEAKEILFAYDRVTRALWDYEDLARVHLAMSGTLMETLSDPGFQNRVYGIVDLGAMLWAYQNERIIRILGTGYYHPVLALIPPNDWKEHLTRWLGKARHLFWRDRFDGFWPPEMGFCMELIPTLKRLGYRYVLVDSEHVVPEDRMRWEEVRYRPHIAEYEGDEIIVVVRDRDLSDAQLSGMDYGWFNHELHERTKWCDFPPLVTTATDGDNGGWFRNTNDKANFWHVFYRDMLDAIRKDWTPIRPTYIEDYLDKYGAHGRVKVSSGAWNTGWHHGVGFVQWTGSQPQKDALARVWHISEQFREALEAAAEDPQRLAQLDQAHWRLLRAETSCNFYWGEAWVDKCHADLDAAVDILEGRHPAED